jgi:uncharacterized membrane protein
MNLSEWIIGPQVPALILGLVGLIQIYFPPKSINGLDLYLTSSPEKNEQIRVEAVRFFPRYLIKVSLILFIAGILITIILNLTLMPAQLRDGLRFVCTFMFTTMSICLVLVKMNKHLGKI